MASSRRYNYNLKMPVLDLSRHGLTPAGPVHANLSYAELVEHALRRNEGQLAENGAFNALTGERTARSPDDKYIVRDSSVASEIDWGKTNQPMDPSRFRSVAPPGA